MMKILLVSMKTMMTCDLDNEDINDDDGDDDDNNDDHC